MALQGSPCLHPMFIGVAVSGGGARAANFGLGVLTQLDNLGIYGDVTAISSVSGGSLAAASFAISPPIDDEQFNKRAAVFRTDFLQSWLLDSVKPNNFIASLTSGRNSTHSLADVFDRTVFDGARFGQLGVRKSGSPSLLINASLLHPVPSSRPLTTRGLNSPADQLQGFTFTQEVFNELGSDLAQMRIADAVAASGAYPGLFHSLTLENFDAKASGIPRSKYLHLSDGGTSDNLGIDALLHAYGETLFYIQDASCLLIVVDSHVTDPLDRSQAVADIRTTPFDYIVSPSFFKAFDLLLDRRREDQLRGIGIELASDHPKRFVSEVQISLGNQAFWGNGRSASRGRSLVEGREMRLVGGKQITHAPCAVWHIALDRLMELTKDGSKRQRGAFRNQQESAQYTDTDERDQKFLKLNEFVNTIRTNYKLEVNGKCSTKTIQDALFTAAFQLTAGDDDSLNSLQQWFRQHHRPQLADNIDAELAWYRKHDDSRKVTPPDYQIKGAANSDAISDSVICNE